MIQISHRKPILIKNYLYGAQLISNQLRIQYLIILIIFIESHPEYFTTTIISDTYINMYF